MEPNESVEPNTSSSFSSPRPTKLRAAQIRLLLAQSGIGSIGALLGAVTLGAALWKVVSHEYIVIWVVTYAGLFLGRHYLLRSFHSRKHDDYAVIKWGKWHSLVVAAGGLLWGAAGVWLFPQDSILHQFLLSIFVAGIAAAGAVIYSPTRDYVANILLALLPLSGRFIFEFDEFHLTIGGVILLFAGVLLLTGRKMHRVYAVSLSLRSDKEDLVTDLKDEIARRDRLEVELKRARDELEVRVEARTAELKTLNRTLEQEIVERKRADEALTESEARYRQLTENSLTGVFVHQDGIAVYVNNRLAEMLGYAPEEMIGRPFLDAVHPDDHQPAAENARARLKGDPSPSVYELRLLTKTGDVIWAEELATLIDYRDRPAIMGNIADITQRKKAEEEREAFRNQLLQAQKLEAIGTLTGGIAHDFNNLLTVINGYTELILSTKTENHPDYSDLERILETGHKGAELVQRLLALSRKGESSPQPLDLNRTVEDSSKLMERTFPKMIRIETILEKNLGMVNADASQIEQVLMNLCINAKEAMPEGGRLKIETGDLFVNEEYCSLYPAAKPGRHVLIEISDTGTGMSKETMDRIFDPFFTTKGWGFKKGTGLGLSVVKGIVEQHGGWVTCRSKPGKGTIFRMYFPAIEDLPVVEKLEPPVEPLPGTVKILLVDDEDYVRDLGKRILEGAGYTVITAANGMDALEIYALEKSAIGLVVLDLIMPRMGGEKCLKELLKIDPNVKVIVSTGHSLETRERLLLEALASGFVKKPYEVRQLAQAVKEVTDAE